PGVGRQVLLPAAGCHQSPAGSVGADRGPGSARPAPRPATPPPGRTRDRPVPSPPRTATSSRRYRQRTQPVPPHRPSRQPPRSHAARRPSVHPRVRVGLPAAPHGRLSLGELTPTPAGLHLTFLAGSGGTLDKGAGPGWPRIEAVGFRLLSAEEIAL